ncbi:MAG: sulfite exporter TauE/SafE family protein [Deltaproteobacteria bacterium]|nr:sulfite exporter TauE/SafE family protein [Deltaproteobacteria bacterium]
MVYTRFRPHTITKEAAMLIVIEFLALGLVAGIFGGIFGLGGGVILIPALVYIFGFSQHSAQGTTLAIMVPPIGLLAAWRYYTNGYVDLHATPLICLGFFFGGLMGAQMIQPVPDLLLKRLFGGFLLLVAVRMMFGK